ncbi:hypothetical protein [uncultured Nostoc sp.]|uniref:hypothetical protein n=1 Tax=uncultured Nostoc sp. TaxID=340711 RepID=UPI0035C9F614
MAAIIERVIAAIAPQNFNKPDEFLSSVSIVSVVPSNDVFEYFSFLYTLFYLRIDEYSWLFVEYYTRSPKQKSVYENLGVRSKIQVTSLANLLPNPCCVIV